MQQLIDQLRLRKVTLQLLARLVDNLLHDAGPQPETGSKLCGLSILFTNCCFGGVVMPMKMECAAKEPGSKAVACSYRWPTA